MTTGFPGTAPLQCKLFVSAASFLLHFLARTRYLPQLFVDREMGFVVIYNSNFLRKGHFLFQDLTLFSSGPYYAK